MVAEAGFPGDHWPASLPELVTFSFRERPCLKNKVERDSGRHPVLTSHLHMHVHTHDRIKYTTMKMKKTGINPAWSEVPGAHFRVACAALGL